jgi:hypothetical protein
LHIKSKEMEIATLKREIRTGFGSIHYPKGCTVEVEDSVESPDRCRVKRLDAKGPIVILIEKKYLKFATVKWKKII